MNTINNNYSSVTSNAFFFNAENPTCRYSLFLENQTDRSVADNLVALSAWERRICENANGVIVDTSQYGERHCLRNIVMNGQPMRPNEFSGKFSLVHAGLLEMDYRTRIFTFMWSL